MDRPEDDGKGVHVGEMKGYERGEWRKDDVDVEEGVRRRRKVGVGRERTRQSIVDA